MGKSWQKRTNMNKPTGKTWFSGFQLVIWWWGKDEKDEYVFHSVAKGWQVLKCWRFLLVISPNLHRFQQSQVIPEEIGQSGCPNAKLVPDWTTEQVLPWACRSDKGISVRNLAKLFHEVATDSWKPLLVSKKWQLLILAACEGWDKHG